MTYISFQVSNRFEVGDKVRVLRNGKPLYTKRTVVGIEDLNPVDGRREIGVICELDDDTWEFHWNLVSAT